MEEFWSVYRWGMNMKFHMAIYTIALVCVKSVVNLLQGVDTVSIWTMLEMILLSLVLAVGEVLLFPGDRGLEGDALRGRTAAWVLLGNLLFGGGAIVFRWFDGVPAWGGVLLVLLLELGFLSMWVGLHVAQRKDTKKLNENLHSFQVKP